MSQVINTNVMSLNAQRNLANTGTALATSLERLSSGLRINSAKDDAAGLAISERFTTQIRGLNQAVRNANDGISLAQTGEGALAEINNNLQRIRELAVQSANATNSDSDRAALDQEVQQRLAEIDRIAGQTSFNGRNILDGSFGDALFQVGANVGETIEVGLDTSMRQGDIGAVANANTLDLRELITEGVEEVSFEVEGLDFEAGDGVSGTVNIGDTEINIEDAGSLADVAAQINDEAPDGVIASVENGSLVFTVGEDAEGTYEISMELTDDGATDGVTVDAEIAELGDATVVTAGEGATTDGGLDDVTFTELGDSTITLNGYDIEVDLTDVTDGDTFADAIETAIQEIPGFGGFEVAFDGTDDALTFTNTIGEEINFSMSVNDEDGAEVADLNATITAATLSDVNEETVALDNDAEWSELELDGLTGSFSIGDAEITFTSEGDTLQDVADAINSALGDEGIVALEFSVNDGELVATNNSGETITITDFQVEDGTGTEAATYNPAAQDLVVGESVTIEEGGLVFQIGEEGTEMSVAAGTYDNIDDFVNAVNLALGSNATAQYDDSTGVMSIVTGQDITISGDDAEQVFETVGTIEAEGSLATVNVLTADAANDAMHRIDSALTSVSEFRSTFGAIQNRFESTIANLSTTVENLSASRSRIQDADFAVETANLTRAQILQQAGTAMLAQANQVPQNVLSLLR